MYPFPNLPNTSSTGRQLLLDIADQMCAAYNGPDARNRADFAAGGSLHDFLIRRNVSAIWNSPMPPASAIADIAADPKIMALLRAVVSDEYIGGSSIAVRMACAAFDINDDSERLVKQLGWCDCKNPVSLWYVGCTWSLTTVAERMKQSDKTRVQVLVDIAMEMGVLQQYLGRVLLRQTFEQAKTVPEEIAHLKTVVRLALGPPALNCAPGGVHHILTLSASTIRCINDLCSAMLQPTAELLAKNDGRDMMKDDILRNQIRDAYATVMPAELRELMTKEVLQLAVEQSCQIETWHGAVPSAILAKDISAEAFAGAIPFFCADTPCRGPRLIAEAERHIAGDIMTTLRGQRAFRGPFRDLWEVLGHVLWKLARIWLADWLKIIRPMAVFAMGGQIVRGLAESLAIDGESPQTSRVPMFRLAGRPMVVTFQVGGGRDNVCLMIPCIDPGKAKYNPLASPFEQELIAISKAIHSDPGRGALTLVTELKRLRRPELGGPLLRLGHPESPDRKAWVAALVANVIKAKTAGRALLLPDALPGLAFGEVGDLAWITCVSSVAEGTDLWESMKSWGTSPTDSMMLAERRVYAALRFSKMAMQPAAIIAANNARVAAIGAPGYSLLPYDKQSYEYTCETCSEPFLCDDRGRCGDRHEHKHNGKESSFRRERIVALSFVTSILCTLEAKGKLSPLPSLVREIPATVAMGVGAATEVSVFVARDAAFLVEELEFLAMLEHIRTREHPADAKESEPLSLAGNAALIPLPKG
ncbi:hypothetical protein HDU86_004152 [Geranomyces michiganensis]|nr:hypothetical protein HDU86_004152 [Geranomyces michiganensis]